MNILRLAINDLRDALRERMTIVWWLAMPLAFVFLFGFVIGDYTSGGTYLPVFQHDDHELADLFVEQLKDEGYWVSVRPLEEESKISSSSLAIVIPADFSRRVFQDERVDLTLIQGSGGRDNLLAAQALLTKVLIKLNTAVAAVDLVENGWSPEIRADLIEELDKPQLLSVEIGQDPSLKPPPSGFAFTLPAYLVMFVMMMAIMYGGISLLYDRIEKRIHRLAAAPLSMLEIFLGKLMGRMFQPLLQSIILIVAGVAIFSIDFGDHPLVLIPVILSFAFFCGSLGLLFGVLARTEQQVIGLGILVSNVFAALGGCWWPLEIVPPTFKTVALFTPSYWAVKGIQDVMYFGKSWMDVLPECTILVLIGAALTSIALPMFRRV